MKRAWLIGALLIAAGPAWAFEDGRAWNNEGPLTGFVPIPGAIHGDWNLNQTELLRVSPNPPKNCTIIINQGGATIEGCDFASEPGKIQATEHGGSVVIRKAN